MHGSAGRLGGLAYLSVDAVIVLGNITAVDAGIETPLHGGAIYSEVSGSVNITSSTFDGFKSTGRGGFLFVDEQCLLAFTDVSINGAEAEYGAALYISERGSVLLDSVRISSCVAQRAAGGIYFDGTLRESKFHELHISNCMATGTGALAGAIFIDDSASID